MFLFGKVVWKIWRKRKFSKTEKLYKKFGEENFVNQNDIQNLMLEKIL